MLAGMYVSPSQEIHSLICRNFFCRILNSHILQRCISTNRDIFPSKLTVQQKLKLWHNLFQNKHKCNNKKYEIKMTLWGNYSVCICSVNVRSTCLNHFLGSDVWTSLKPNSIKQLYVQTLWWCGYLEWEVFSMIVKN